MNLTINDVRDQSAEAGIIATLLRHPDFIYHSEDLSPRHFFDEVNGYIYWGIKRCVENDITNLDAINISAMFNQHCDASKTDKITQELLNEIIALGHLVERNTIEEYNVLVDSVIDKSLRRDILKEIKHCESICYGEEGNNAKTEVYNILEKIISEYDGTDRIEPLGKHARELWEKIKESQNDDNFIDFKFPSLNRYCKISRTDCICFSAREKRGKSILLLNCLVDLLKKGHSVLYIDTELSTQLFFMRLLSHLTQIPFYMIRDGNLTQEQLEKIDEQIRWVERTNFTHEYMPIVEDDKILSLVKKYKHKYGCDGLILDYLKGNGEYALDAYKNSASLGKTTDLLKNIIAGKENMFVLTAVQATKNNEVADSAKIIRNSSALILLERKTDKEIQEDGGIEFGNMKICVTANRNGELHKEGEYISLSLDGNRCTFEESRQPVKEVPY